VTPTPSGVIATTVARRCRSRSSARRAVTSRSMATKLVSSPAASRSGVIVSASQYGVPSRR
jgi:hypothetical protein